MYCVPVSCSQLNIEIFATCFVLESNSVQNLACFLRFSSVFKTIINDLPPWKINLLTCYLLCKEEKSILCWVKQTQKDSTAKDYLQYARPRSRKNLSFSSNEIRSFC